MKISDPIKLPFSGPSVLACGSDGNNRFCLTHGDEAFMSPDMGDLSEYQNFKSFQEGINELCKQLDIIPEIIAYDMHPDYVSSRHALSLETKKKIPVQHHHAHIAACMTDNGLNEKVLGVALDGTGYGPDNTSWGGEFLIADYSGYIRAGHLKQYPMPGGDEAVLNPSRMALSCLHTEAEDEFQQLAKSLFPEISESDLNIIEQMIQRNIRSPLSSSAGRLFDIISALLGICRTVSHSGEAAIKLEAETQADIDDSYSFKLETDSEPLILSFAPMILEILSDIENNISKSIISAKFHNTFAEAVVHTAEHICRNNAINKVVLSGGVFFNKIVTPIIRNKLTSKELHVYTHNLTPTSDVSLALGQAAIALKI